MGRRSPAIPVHILAGVVLIGAVVVPRPAAGHVDYVTSGSGTPQDPLPFLLSVVTEPVNAGLLTAGVLIAIITCGAYLLVGRHLRDVAVLRETLRSYGDLLPWMLRLSLGLPLVGAGFSGYLFTPAVGTSARLFQVGLGFLLLFGLATRTVAAVGLLSYLALVVVDPDLLLAVEYVGGFMGIALVGAGRPSADEMLRRVAEADGTIYGRIDPIHEMADVADRWLDPLSRFTPTVVRVGLGVTFVSLGLGEKLLAPGQALQVVAKYDLTAVVPVDPGLWVVGAGLLEVAIGVALVVGLFTRGVAALAFLVLTGTLFGLPDDPVLVHVTLFGLSSALFATGSGPVALDNHLDRVLDAATSTLGSLGQEGPT